jgi:LPXTG-motif cell wall-anchored protein
VACIEGLMHGLYLLWWVQEKHVSPALVASILAGGDLLIAAIEIPTGWFADRFGHRRSLIVGSLVQVAGTVWCWLGDGASGVLIATMLVALGDGFRSGADQALLYRSCVALDRATAFQAIEARTRAAEQTALVVQVLAGGFIVSTWGFAAGWIAETLLCAAGLVIACAMREPPAQPDAEDAHETPRGHARWQAIASVIVPAAVLGSMASAAGFLAQTDGETGTWPIALLVATIVLAEAAGAALATRLPQTGAAGQILLLAAGIVAVAAGLASAALFQVMVCALAFLEGVSNPLRAAAIQALAGDSVRARAASIAHACDMVFRAMTLPIAGVWRGRRRPGAR